MRRVFVDTSVLFPFSVMDLFLALSENVVIRVLWTDELLDEWAGVIVRGHHRSPESAASVTAAVREFFDDDRIDPIIYSDRIEAMPGPDTADHVHSAAAIAADVEALVTWDRSGFPVDDLADLGLRVVDPDTYLIELLADSPDEVHATIVELARSKTRPPMSTDDLLAALERAGLTRFPELVRATR